MKKIKKDIKFYHISNNLKKKNETKQKYHPIIPTCPNKKAKKIIKSEKSFDCLCLATCTKLVLQICR